MKEYIVHIDFWLEQKSCKFASSWTYAASPQLEVEQIVYYNINGFFYINGPARNGEDKYKIVEMSENEVWLERVDV